MWPTLYSVCSRDLSKVEQFSKLVFFFGTAVRLKVEGFRQCKVWEVTSNEPSITWLFCSCLQCTLNKMLWIAMIYSSSFNSLTSSCFILQHTYSVFLATPPDLNIHFKKWQSLESFAKTKMTCTFVHLKCFFIFALWQFQSSGLV